MQSYLQSEANVVDAIVSSPDVGINSIGLTERGRQQAKEVCHQIKVAQSFFYCFC